MKALCSSVKSFSDLYKQTQELLLSPVVLSLVYTELRNVFVCIGTHFLAVFIVCKLAWCFYS